MSREPVTDFSGRRTVLRLIGLLVAAHRVRRNIGRRLAEDAREVEFMGIPLPPLDREHLIDTCMRRSANNR